MSVIDSRSAQLSALLSAVAENLQLDKTRYERAETAYGSVGRWLESGLPSTAAVDVYPQGSMQHGTTTKPRGRDEHDLDIVAQLLGVTFPNSEALFRWGMQRLMANGHFAKIAEPMKRCVRLNYAGDFHLDVLFALPLVGRVDPDTRIRVPDRRLREFVVSDPRGFDRWFQSQCDIEALIRKRALATKAMAPLPSQDSVEHQALLKTVVQLIKRRRDVYFDGSDDATRSIVLTTLAAKHYSGSTDVFTALLHVLDGIAGEIALVPPGGRLQVLNPTNPLEDFSESWAAKPAAYAQSLEFLCRFLAEVRVLEESTGPSVDQLLEAMFGERVAKHAREHVTRQFTQAVNDGDIRSAGSRLTAVAGAGRVIRSHTFYGDDTRTSP